MSIFNRTDKKIRKVNTFKHYTMISENPTEWDFKRADYVYFLKEVKALRIKLNMYIDEDKLNDWPNLEEGIYEEGVCPILTAIKIKKWNFAEDVALVTVPDSDYWLDGKTFLVSKKALGKYAVALFITSFENYEVMVKGPKTYFEWPALGFCSRRDKNYGSYLNSKDDNLKKLTFPLLSFFLFTKQEVIDSFSAGIIDTFNNAMNLYMNLDLSTREIEDIIFNLSTFMKDIHKTIASIDGYLQLDDTDEDVLLLMNNKKKEDLAKEEEKRQIETHKKDLVDSFITMTNSRRDLLKQFNEI